MKKIILTVFLCLLMLSFANAAVFAAGPTGDVGAPGATVDGQTPGTGVNINDTVNNNTYNNNNANTNVNINNSNVNNSNVGSNNNINQTNNVSNVTNKTLQIKQYVKVMVGGKPLESDVPSFINGDNRTMVTLRAIAEALGAKVDWDPGTQTITITQGDKVVKLVIGENKYTVNGQEFTMDTAPGISKGRTVVPARVVGEALGAKVGWDPKTTTVNVETDPQTEPPTNQTTQPTTQTEQPVQWAGTFPMGPSKVDNFTTPVKSRACTNSTLWQSGLFDANTTISFSEKGVFKMTVEVYANDAKGNALWKEIKQYELRDNMPLDKWSTNVPTEIMPKVASVTLVHTVLSFKKQETNPNSGAVAVSTVPLTAHDKNDRILNKDRWNMESDATFYLSSGKLDVKTKTGNEDPILGFTGAVQVGVWDASGNLIWTSGVHTFGVDATTNIFSRSYREDSWSETAPAEILSKAVKLEIRHGHKSQTENGKSLF